MVLKILCNNNNHEFSGTLISQSYTNRLKTNKQSMIIDITKSLVKSTNILITLKENNDIVTTKNQLYYVGYWFKRSHRKYKTEIQQLMFLLEHISHCIIQNVFWIQNHIADL